MTWGPDSDSLAGDPQRREPEEAPNERLARGLILVSLGSVVFQHDVLEIDQKKATRLLEHGGRLYQYDAVGLNADGELVLSYVEQRQVTKV